MDEFALIDEFFAGGDVGPSVDVPIGDDGAVVTPSPDHKLVVVADTSVAGVHFPQRFPAADLGFRAVQVNLSDIAAMGARPRWMTLSLTLPAAEPAWLRDFSGGLREAAGPHGVALIGGDTTRGSQLVVCVQVLGEIGPGEALLRSGAKAGDTVYVSGWLGDAAAGLELMTNGKPSNEARQRLVERFSRPAARVELGRNLLGVASSAIDVSDGFASDVAKLVAASGLGADLEAARLPLSDALLDELPADEATSLALTGGDDYELCFTVPPGDEAIVADVAKSVDVRLTRVGRVVTETGVRAKDARGEAVPVTTRGYRHFGDSS